MGVAPRSVASIRGVIPFGSSALTSNFVVVSFAVLLPCGLCLWLFSGLSPSKVFAPPSNNERTCFKSFCFTASNNGKFASYAENLCKSSEAPSNLCDSGLSHAEEEAEDLEATASGEGAESKSGRKLQSGMRITTPTRAKRPLLDLGIMTRCMLLLSEIVLADLSNEPNDPGFEDEDDCIGERR